MPEDVEPDKPKLQCCMAPNVVNGKCTNCQAIHHSDDIPVGEILSRPVNSMLDPTQSHLNRPLSPTQQAERDEFLKNRPAKNTPGSTNGEAEAIKASNRDKVRATPVVE